MHKFPGCRYAVAAGLLLSIGFTVQGAKFALAQDGAGPAAVAEASPVSFSPDSLSIVPAVFPATEFTAEGVRSLFFEGPDYQGRPTRIFAWYGVPPASKNSSSASAKKLPAMVLIHGGGGTAFDRWVRLWNSRGYAAIAMDVCGCVPKGTYGKWERHEHGGPPGWDASFGQLDSPIEDQWTWHAVSAVCRAHSLIRSFPEVDPDRVGVTGISWGGYLTSIVAGVDQRFRLAVPVYGCGFLGENSAWLPRFESMGAEKSKQWLGHWDPSGYLPKATMPILWVNGTNDFAYPMDSWKKSYLLPASPQTICLRIRMPHGHGAAGENPEEIHVFANSILAQGKPLPVITRQETDGDHAWAEYTSEVPVTRAELCFTRDRGRWQDREWHQMPAVIDQQNGQIQARVPDDATVFYMNLFDERDCVVSTRHEER